jgi:hypothetical protein
MGPSLETRAPNPPTSGVSRRALLGWGVAAGVAVAGGLGYALTRARLSPSRISELISYHGHSQAVNALAWSPDSRRIASSAVHGPVHIWSVTS